MATTSKDLWGPTINIKALLRCRLTEQVGSDSNASDLHSGVWLKSFDETQAVLNQDFHGCPQSLQANSGRVHKKLDHANCFPTSLPIHYSVPPIPFNVTTLNKL
jgi:hypothetical protein